MGTVTVPQILGHIDMVAILSRYCCRIFPSNQLGYLTPNGLQTAICLIGCLCCFLPVVIGPHVEFELKELDSALTSDRNRNLAVAALALTAPIFIEMAADYCTNIFVGAKSKRIRMHVRESLLKPYEQFLLTCSILSVPTIAFLPSDTDHVVTTYFCINRFRILLVGGLVLISLSRFNKKIWTTNITYIVLCLLATSEVTGSYADNLGLLENTVMRKVADSLLIVGLGIFCLCSCKWFYFSVPIVLRMKSRVHDVETLVNQNAPRMAEQHLVFPLVYIASANVGALFVIASTRIIPKHILEDDWFFISNLGYVTYLIFLLTISERMAKYEVLQGLVSSIASHCIIYCLPSYKFVLPVFIEII
jgi:hypothetical protein